ncbi:MAG: hypothetical protein A3F31_00420 [Candidatus Levybacteria bacterium RIFCSPHIGHO2_12_FULL_38_12]|nr:MAG: hypothetical protein A2770_03490 [Candidatus Levybacteria bacterium RIFCSPHIGHO2_01_FULL_38_12]OGH23223.1 MAG: hypothetical protein A3F31_00420 [Candidatus Levybacteria bacterium RIFCSPHIGHO2_12_FULL_38_12]OGH34501.1 MAG: hypothetical protein A3A47_00940 [Candidatus Levybacteria bacterium RIFCSPLOWO2_01_FULL_37_20]OGH44749.1 MAG: hypothetical protein A3J14_00300 [Candidatus Levybacteria bacterium RIFCSPLOWO2_02_FULL_37_18]
MREGRRAVLTVFTGLSTIACGISPDTPMGVAPYPTSTRSIPSELSPVPSDREVILSYVSTLSIQKDPTEVGRWANIRSLNPPIRKQEITDNDKSLAERRLVAVLNEMNRSNIKPFRDAHDVLTSHRNKDASIGVYKNLSSVLKTEDAYQMVALPLYKNDSVEIHIGLDTKHILETDLLVLATEIVHEVTHLQEYLGFLTALDPSHGPFEKFIELKGIETNDQIRFEGELVAYKIQAESYMHAIAQGHTITSRFDDELAATLIRANGDIHTPAYQELIKKLSPESRI